MAFLLLLPASIQLIHSFEQHEQTICTSKVENHIHENDFKCELCHLQAKTFAILPTETFSLSENKINFKKATNYQFLYKHQLLSFSLRGPPFFNFL